MAIAIAACETAPRRPPAAPPLQMIRSGQLVVPQDCAASGSVVVDYMVGEDGQTDDIHVPSAPACLQAALSEWVASFRYAPQQGEVPASIEWLVVEGKRGT